MCLCCARTRARLGTCVVANDRYANNYTTTIAFRLLPRFKRRGMVGDRRVLRGGGVVTDNSLRNEWPTTIRVGSIISEIVLGRAVVGRQEQRGGGDEEEEKADEKEDEEKKSKGIQSTWAGVLLYIPCRR